jgi:hypothetical protein
MSLIHGMIRVLARVISVLSIGWKHAVLIMNTGRICRLAARSLVRLTVAVSLVQASLAATTEEKFSLFQTKTKAYTNVTVTSKTKAYVMILHASGMGSIPVADLTPELVEKLGYAAAAKTPKTNSLSASIGRLTSGLHLPEVKVISQTWHNTLPAMMERYHLTSSDLYTYLAILFGVYLVTCYCLGSICRKAHSEPGFLVWLPLFQLFPMLRAAKMSRWWFLIFCTPAFLLAHIAWCVNIVKARDKSPWVALFMVVPVTTMFAFFYLAFSRSKPLLEAPRYKSMALQVA